MYQKCLYHITSVFSNKTSDIFLSEQNRSFHVFESHGLPSQKRHPSGR